MQHLPQLIFLALWFCGLGVGIAKYGQLKTDRWDLGDILAMFITPGILYWGGFFDGLFT